MRKNQDTVVTDKSPPEALPATPSEESSASVIVTCGAAPDASRSMSSDNEIEAVPETESLSVAVFTILGMQCQACALKVETVLLKLPGVVRVSVEFAQRTATICFDSAAAGIEVLKTAIRSAGYRVSDRVPNDAKAVEPCCGQPIGLFSNPRAYFLGALAAFGIVGIYLGMNTLTSDWYFARIQFSEYRWWIISLAIGLGIQVTLYTLFRAHLRGKKKTAANSSMATSGGISAVAMMACCSHYLATLIPLLGVSFLSATAVASLEQYQPYFFLAGVVSCLFGIGLMVRMMRKHGLFRTGVPKVLMRIRPGRLGNV